MQLKSESQLNFKVYNDFPHWIQLPHFIRDNLAISIVMDLLPVFLNRNLIINKDLYHLIGIISRKG